MKNYLLLSIVAFCAVPVSAQTLDSLVQNRDIFEWLNLSGIYGNRVTLIQPESLQSAIQYHIISNEAKKIQGYRVRIFRSNAQSARDVSLAIKEEFETLFPFVQAYRDHVAIDFRVVVGDFRTRSEATRFRNELMSLPQYRDKPVVIISEAIEFPPL